MNYGILLKRIVTKNDYLYKYKYGSVFVHNLRAKYSIELDTLVQTLRQITQCTLLLQRSIILRFIAVGNPALAEESCNWRGLATQFRSECLHKRLFLHSLNDSFRI